jgi:hypothetical protein
MVLTYWNRRGIQWANKACAASKLANYHLGEDISRPIFESMTTSATTRPSVLRGQTTEKGLVLTESTCHQLTQIMQTLPLQILVSLATMSNQITYRSHTLPSSRPRNQQADVTCSIARTCKSWKSSLL